MGETGQTGTGQKEQMVMQMYVHQEKNMFSVIGHVAYYPTACSALCPAPGKSYVIIFFSVTLITTPPLFF
jgi:hypothetical protein